MKRIQTFKKINNETIRIQKTNSRRNCKRVI